MSTLFSVTHPVETSSSNLLLQRNNMIRGKSCFLSTKHLMQVLQTTTEKYSYRELRQLDYITQYTSYIRYIIKSQPSDNK